MFRFFASWMEFANLTSQERVLMFKVFILMFSNLTDLFVGKRWSEDVVSGNKMELEDKDKLSQPVS